MTTRFPFFLLIFLGMALPAVGQAPDPPRFLLESVVVEGVQRDAVREIVAAESLLQLGHEYSEQELREAVYRIKRLPFVLAAEFSLRKGGERGSYQLVITVEETRLVFFSASAGGVYDGDDRRGGSEDRFDWSGGGSFGGRWFVGSQGVLFGGVSGFETVGLTEAQVGYTRYNLFGRGGFASVLLSTDVSDEYDGESYSGIVSAGIPLVGNHSLRADLDWHRSKDDAFAFAFVSDSRRLALSWIYDTTDDPLFPTSGSRVSAGGGYGEFEQRTDFEGFRNRVEASSYEVGVSARRNWALTSRQSVSGDLATSWSDLIDGGKNEQWSRSVALGHSTDLWGFEKTERFGDLRWENGVSISSYESNSLFFRSSSVDATLGTSLVFRNAWGVTRLSFSYIDNLDRDLHVRDAS